MPCYAVFQPTASVHTCALNGMTDISSVADFQAALDYKNPLHTGSESRRRKLRHGLQLRRRRERTGTTTA